MYRYGGDEFVIITSPNVQKVVVELGKVRENGFFFSYGMCGSFEIENVSKNTDVKVNNILKIADGRMYENKLRKMYRVGN